MSAKLLKKLGQTILTRATKQAKEDAPFIGLAAGAVTSKEIYEEKIKNKINKARGKKVEEPNSISEIVRQLKAKKKKKNKTILTKDSE